MPSALIFGGSDSNADIGNTEEWIGAGADIGAWTTSTDMNTARSQMGSAGTAQNAALGYGGYNGTAGVAITESWNGSAWTEVNDLSQARYQVASGMGRTNTAAWCVTGLTSPPDTLYSNNEVWNGSSWTEVNNANQAKRGARYSLTTCTAVDGSQSSLADRHST